MLKLSATAVFVLCTLIDAQTTSPAFPHVTPDPNLAATTATGSDPVSATLLDTTTTGTTLEPDLVSTEDSTENTDDEDGTDSSPYDVDLSSTADSGDFHDSDSS